MAVFHLVTHAFFKACLFLGSGSVIHGMSGEQDMREMGGLRKKMPVTFYTFVIATLAITGFPLLSGFMSKDAILWNAYIAGEGRYAAIFGAWAKGLWAIGVLSAGFTAFYMWRLVFMTFFSGETRAKPEVVSHIHESPLSMTFALVVLAILSIFGGILGIPHVFGGHDWILGWLQPVVGNAPTPEGNHAALEWGLMAVSVGIAVGGFSLAYALYAKGISPKTAKFATDRATSGLYQGALNKWWVDELYEVTVLRPLTWVSRVVLYEGVDRRVIDFIVNGVGTIAKSLGYLGQIFQTGNIQRYLAVFAVALAVLIYGWLLPSNTADNAQAYQAQAPAAAEVAPEPTAEVDPDAVVREGR